MAEYLHDGLLLGIFKLLLRFTEFVQGRVEIWLTVVRGRVVYAQGLSFDFGQLLLEQTTTSFDQVLGVSSVIQAYQMGRFFDRHTQFKF